ncbi:MAG TPA: ATP-binding protein [Flavihumibacter sp.]
MKEQISRTRGKNPASFGLAGRLRYGWQLWRTKLNDLFVRTGVKEKINNSKLSWEERLVLVSLVIVAGIVLLGIKLFENTRSNQQAYAQLDLSRQILIEAERTRFALHELEQARAGQPEKVAAAVDKGMKSVESIRTLKTHNPLQLNRIISMNSLFRKQLIYGEDADLKRLNQLLDDIKAEETRNLSNRQAEISLGNEIDQRLYALLLATLVVSVLVAAFILYRKQLATKHAKRQLENNKQILQSIIDNSTSLVYVKDMLGRFIFTNRNFTEVYGLSGERLDEAPDEKVLETKVPMETQEEIYLKNKQYHFYAIRFPLLDKYGKVYATAGVFTDLTDMIRKEQEKRRRELKLHTLAVQEHERMEIGMELHDNITQLLASAKLMLDTAIRETNMRDEHLEKAREDVFTAIHETRKLSHALVVPGLETESLTDAILRLVDRLKHQNGMQVQLRLVGKKRINALDPTIRLALYRILQEQVNNILKHAQANKVLIELTFVTDTIQLTIQDDGVGFDPDATTQGIGLSNIMRRVNHLDGECRIHSAPGKGCQLKILIPQ